MNDKEKILKDFCRMCMGGNCHNNCQIGEQCDYFCNEWIMEHPKEAVEFVEEWAAEHPVKTRQGEFFKLHPNARLDSDGVLDIKPCAIDSTLGFSQSGICTRCSNCIKCAREYWSQEVSENE